jgi:hypothetical protein
MQGLRPCRRHCWVYAEGAALSGSVDRKWLRVTPVQCIPVQPDDPGGHRHVQCTIVGPPRSDTGHNLALETQGLKGSSIPNTGWLLDRGG